MEKIKFVRVYEQYGSKTVDIMYHSGKLYTMDYDNMPKTALKFIENHTGMEQYDSIFKRTETIYQ